VRPKTALCEGKTAYNKQNLSSRRTVLPLRHQTRAPTALGRTTKQSIRINAALEDSIPLSLLAIMAILFLSFIGCCLAWVVYARRFHSLAKYPGPFLASITRLWLVIDVARGNSDKTQRRLHRIYGLNEVPTLERRVADKGRPHRPNRAG
jgi:hypothetical protein